MITPKKERILLPPERKRSKQLKIWEAEVMPEVSGEPGTVVAVDKQSFTVAAGEGSLKILELQIEGKKRMACKDFLLGYPVNAGEILGR